MSSANASAHTLRTPCAACPTTRTSGASSPPALTPRSVRASCRCTRGRARGQHERRLAELADPNVDHTWMWRLNPPLQFGPAFLGPPWQARSRLCCADSTEPVACATCQMWHPEHGRHGKRTLRPPSCCGWRVTGFVVRCSVCVVL